MEYATAALTVPGVPTVAASTAVIAETPVSTTTGLTVPGVAVTMNVYISTVVEDSREFTDKGRLLKVMPTVLGRPAIDNNIPQNWTHWGKDIIIDPAPGSDYVYQLLLFMADYPSRELNSFYGTPSDLPAEFHECLVDYACYALSQKLGKWGQASKYYNIYIGNLKQRKQDYINRKTEEKDTHRIPNKGGR